MSDLTNRLRNHSKRPPGCDCVRCEAACVLDAIDALHRPLDDGEYGGVVCTTCVSGTWPCRTYQILHPA